nr:tautomerase family protein [Rhodoferax ferrireducens]
MSFSGLRRRDRPLVEATGTPMVNMRVWIHDVPKESWGIAGVSAENLGR